MFTVEFVICYSFLPPSTGEYPSSKMIMMFDLTASYLILADTTSMVSYINARSLDMYT